MYKLLTIGTAVGFDFSSLDLSPVTESFFKAVPVAIGVVLGIVAFRKGWAFVMGAVKRA